jgi:excinuclease UvrABC nuclease subunit
MPIVVDLPADPDATIDLTALPTRPGVFALEDESGGTLTLAVTANLRRLVSRRLEPVESDEGPTRRIAYRGLARQVAAVTVGSAFEAEWAYLQLARQRLPTTFRSLLDNLRGWFIHANPEAPFPRLVKTSTPGRPPTGWTGMYVGPFNDKHAAQRVIEMLLDLFDLCRYHHILIEAPHGNACAYKEMGKCPAPCDGTIGLETYRTMMHEALAFAATPIEAAVAGLEQRMQAASEALDFEIAATLRSRLSAAVELDKPQYRFRRRLEDFRFLAVASSERRGHARLMLILGGWIEPLVDLPLQPDATTLAAIVSAISDRVAAQSPDLSSEGIENLGLVCQRLFRPERRGKAVPIDFLPIADGIDANDLVRSLRRLKRRRDGRADEENDADADIVDAELEQTA